MEERIFSSFKKVVGLKEKFVHSWSKLDDWKSKKIFIKKY